MPRRASSLYEIVFAITFLVLSDSDVIPVPATDELTKVRSIPTWQSPHQEPKIVTPQGRVPETSLALSPLECKMAPPTFWGRHQIKFFYCAKNTTKEPEGATSAFSTMAEIPAAAAAACAVGSIDASE